MSVHRHLHALLEVEQLLRPPALRPRASCERSELTGELARRFKAVATTAEAAPAIVALHSEKIACACCPVALDSSFCLELIRYTSIDD